jgi:hypothetical protein
MNALTEISAAEQALASAETIYEITEVRDKARAIEVILQTIDAATEVAQKASLLRIRAERRAGEWLIENIARGNPLWSPGVTLVDTGVSRNQSAKWQLIARVPEERFNEWVDERVAYGWDLSTAGAVRFAENYLAKHNDRSTRISSDPWIRVPPSNACWLRGYLRDCDGPITGGHIIHKGEVRGNARAREMLAACPDEIMAPQCYEHNVGRWANNREAKRILLTLKIFQLGYPRIRAWFDEFEATWKVLPPELTLEVLLDVQERQEPHHNAGSGAGASNRRV